jgi:type IV pilus assembly protein PilA
MTGHRSLRNRAFTLVELMIVVAIIGIIAALAVYGVGRHLRAAKVAEAKQSVGQIARGAVGAYERERSPSELMAEGGQSASVSNALCESATPIPATVPKARKYQPSSAAGQDFQTGDAETGWKCLMFAISQPIYFRYSYTKNGSTAAPNNPGACVADCFEAGANGDLDGDGAVSSFAMTGQINTKTGALLTATQIYSSSEDE